MDLIKRRFLENYKKYGFFCLEGHQNYLHALARKDFGTSKFLKLPEILETSYQRDINYYDAGRKYYQEIFQINRRYFRYLRG